MAISRNALMVVLIVKMMIATSLQAQLGMEDGRLTDVQITASSCFDGNHCTDRARLNQPLGNGKTGAWSARTNDQDQYIQVDLRQLHEVSGVMTQGRNGYSQWVTSFRVLSSLDGLTFTPIPNAMMAGSDIFNGNSDRDTIVTNDFSANFVSRFIRFEPVTWANHISMRFEVLGSIASKVEGPQKALGMKFGQIPDNAITASTVYDANHGAERSRLDTAAGAGKTGAWSARTNDVNQWLQVDLNSFYIITGVITQGRQDANQWVTGFRVESSDDGVTFNPILDCSGNQQVFTGNADRNTKVTTEFARPITGRFLRIRPSSWNGHISMRLEILGKGAVAGQRFEPLKLGMEDGRIADSQLSSSTCYDVNHCVDRARLNQVAGGGRTGAWSAQVNDHSQWIEVDLLTDFMFSGVVIQGRSDANQWVTGYSLQYRPDGQTTLIDIVDENGAAQIFSGSSDRDSLVISMLPLPVTARYVRIHPETWSGHISMRFELLGDGPINVVSTPGKLGIEDGRIAASSLSASSCYDGNHCVDRSRLNQPRASPFTGAWSARTNDLDQWIQVDLRQAFEVTGIITQGRNSWPNGQWVQSYQMSYSIDGKDWILVKGCLAETQIFPGNFDADSLVENAISPPVTARFFRLHPVHWNNHISLRWELIGMGPTTLAGSSRKLGLEDYRIPDSAITASTQYDANHGPQRARLNLPLSGALKGAWSALTLDHSQWLQVDLQGNYRVTGIITQGRASADQWVTMYTVAYSRNGEDFTTISSPSTPLQDKVFVGNGDRSTQVTNYFAPPFTARFVRVLPDEWHGHISMRIEILGAGPVANMLSDAVPLGLESTVIPDSSLTASSEWDPDHGPKRARLNLARVGILRGAWSARTNNVNQWIQVDLLSPYRIFAVATQGRQDLNQWVTSYKIACSSDGATFDTVQGICTNAAADRIFTANTDRNTIVTNSLPVPQVCRFVRLLPATWNSHISLRMELYGEGPLTE
nr:nectin variant 3 [Paracentrotus lividus]